jgi:hypothetical protein
MSIIINNKEYAVDVELLKVNSAFFAGYFSHEWKEPIHVEHPIFVVTDEDVYYALAMFSVSTISHDGVQLYVVRWLLKYFLCSDSCMAIFKAHVETATLEKTELYMLGERVGLSRHNCLCLLRTFHGVPADLLRELELEQLLPVAILENTDDCLLPLDEIGPMVGIGLKLDLHPTLCRLSWSGVLLSGGYLLEQLLGTSDITTDVDLFVYGSTHEERLAAMRQAVAELRNNDTFVFQNKQVVTLVVRGLRKNIQVVDNSATDPESVLNNFTGIDYTKVLYDGKSLHCTPSFLVSFIRKTAVFYSSTVQLSRLYKARKKGYTIALLDSVVKVVGSQYYSPKEIRADTDGSIYSKDSSVMHSANKYLYIIDEPEDRVVYLFRQLFSHKYVLVDGVQDYTDKNWKQSYMEAEASELKTVRKRPPVSPSTFYSSIVCIEGSPWIVLENCVAYALHFENQEKGVLCVELTPSSVEKLHPITKLFNQSDGLFKEGKRATMSIVLRLCSGQLQCRCEKNGRPITTKEQLLRYSLPRLVTAAISVNLLDARGRTVYSRCARRLILGDKVKRKLLI